MNTYSYVLNNPLYWVDPTGEIGLAGGVTGAVLIAYGVNWWYWNVENPEPFPNPNPLPPPDFGDNGQSCGGNWKPQGSDPWGNGLPWPDPKMGRSRPIPGGPFQDPGSTNRPERRPPSTRMPRK